MLSELMPEPVSTEHALATTVDIGAQLLHFGDNGCAWPGECRWCDRSGFSGRSWLAARWSRAWSSVTYRVRLPDAPRETDHLL